MAETVARELFAPLGPTYDRYANLLSFGQDPRWRRFLVSRVRRGPGRDRARRRDRDGRRRDRARPPATAAASSASTRAPRCSRPAARASSGQASTTASSCVEGRAEALPFDDASFDALTFTYLLRYVDDPAATLRELARVVRPGGTIAALEFGVPPAPVWRALWELWVRVGLPGAGRIVSPGWREVGPLPRPEHPRLLRALPAARARAALERGGHRGRAVALAQPRRRRRHLGTARLSAEPRPAFYALAPGGWRDYVTLLHPPYTLWHLSYVAIGAALAPHFALGAARRGARRVRARAWASARTRSTSCRGARSPRASRDASSWALAAVSIAGAVAIGIAAAIAWTLWLLPLVAFGGFIVCRVQPRALGRPLPRRPLVRDRVGRAAGARRLRR